MTNSLKFLLALSLVAGLSACGDDSNSPSSPVDAGPSVVLKPVDAGTPVSTTNPDGGPVVTTTPNGDAGTPVVVTPGVDGGITTPTTCGTATDCFCGTPVKMVDFLNRCTTAQTTTKTLAVPANLLTPTGDVMPL